MAVSAGTVGQSCLSAIWDNKNIRKALWPQDEEPSQWLSSSSLVQRGCGAPQLPLGLSVGWGQTLESPVTGTFGRGTFSPGGLILPSLLRGPMKGSQVSSARGELGGWWGAMSPGAGQPVLWAAVLHPLLGARVCRQGSTRGRRDSQEILGFPC